MSCTLGDSEKAAFYEGLVRKQALSSFARGSSNRVLGGWTDVAPEINRGRGRTGAESAAALPAKSRDVMCGE